MKRQYIRQVKRELNWSPSVRRKVARDLDEAFASALEHGETERQVIERLGTPQEFAESIAEQFGVDRAARARRRALIVASVPELTMRTISRLGMAATTSSARVTSAGQGAP